MTLFDTTIIFLLVAAYALGMIFLVFVILISVIKILKKIGLWDLADKLMRWAEK